MTDDSARFAPSFYERVTTGIAITSPRNFTRAMVEDVAREHGTTFERIMSHDRHRSVVIARCAAMRKVSAARPRWSYPELGRFFGGMDHTSVMYHVDKKGLGRAECSCDKWRGKP